MFRRIFLVGTAILLLACSKSDAADIAEASQFISELGCAACHTTLSQKPVTKERAPDLSTAGLRYNPAWLFEFLQRPVKVRRHIGHSRMPGFHLSDEESLALVEFLTTQTNIPGAWPELPSVARSSNNPTPQEFQSALASGLLCLNCHTLDGKGGALGVELGDVSFRLRRDWVKEYLVFPERFGVAPGLMPPQFYAITNGHFQSIVPDASHKIQVVADYLFSRNASRRQDLQDRFDRAKQSATNAAAETGRRLFTALNCAGCHRHSSINPKVANAAPDLTQESKRVKRTWLESYLQHPFAIRPLGFQPGDGSRMPDFRLTQQEVATVVGSISAAPPRVSAPPRALSAFAIRKATLLLTDKLSCLGCHRLGERGGRIGPDFNGVRDRLQPDYVLSVIQNPRETNPHSIMPRVPMTDDTRRLIGDFLVQQPQPPSREKYVSLVGNVPTIYDANAPASPPNTYARHCALCHGPTGNGDGLNARYLPVRPTAHADSGYMSRRPDDTLFDGIHSGAGILNRSPYMPPWGETFSRTEIAGLVQYIRQLCHCAGPEWSRDGTR